MPRCFRHLLGAAALLAAACSASVDPPDASGKPGEWLVNLGSVQCNASPVASFSGDGHWMLFWLEHFQPDAGMRLPLVSPALLELDSLQLVLPAGPAVRTQGPSFDPASLCWDDAGQAVFVRSSSLPSHAERRWYRAETGLAAELVGVPAPPAHCRRPRAAEWQWHRQDSSSAEIRGDLNIVRDGCCAVELRRADGRLMARHEARSTLSDQVLISRYAWSESGTRLAYTLNEETSWRFARPSASFVLDQARQAQLLDGQIYAFAWHGDDRLIACAERPRSEGGGSGLKSWRFNHGPATR